MVRDFYLLLAISPFLAAQNPSAKSVTVAPGAQSDLTIRVESPQPGDFIDLLEDNTSGGVILEVYRPDGRELTAANMAASGVDGEFLTHNDLTRLAPSLRKALLSGSGDHARFVFGNGAKAGTYRVRIDNRAATTPVHVEAALIRVPNWLETLRNTPGVIIARPIRVEPGSEHPILTLPLSQTSEETVIDVASTRNPITIRLRLPDGTVVTSENAKSSGFEWQQVRNPPDVGGDDAEAFFRRLILYATMLPVQGLHYQIGFPAGVRQAGNYVVEVDGSRLRRAAQVSVMFIPIDVALREIE